MCAEAGAQGPGPLSFLFGYQRPLSYHFQISQEQRERETTDRKGIFFPPPFSFRKVHRMCAPSHFTEENSYSLGLKLGLQRKILT